MAALKPESASLDELSSIPSAEKQVSLQNQGVEALRDVVYGSTAGMLGKVIEMPFDSIKVRAQSKQISPYEAFVAAYRSPEGPFRSLYRGISAPLVGAAIETSCLFFSYRVAQDLVVASSPSLRRQKEQQHDKIQLPFQQLLLCGAASGAFTSLALTPIELVKCKMQVPVHAGAGTIGTQSMGILQHITTIFRTHGLFGFWHGQLATLIRETGGSAVWFGAYEGAKLLCLKYDNTISKIEDVKVWQQMSAGAVAGMAYNLAPYPVDTIKSKLQTEEVGMSKKRGTFMSTAKDLWRQSGVRGFYRGCGITVFRAAPSSAIIFSIYEALRKSFG
jgi:mitochondrial ornithine carrier protein